MAGRPAGRARRAGSRRCCSSGPATTAATRCRPCARLAARGVRGGGRAPRPRSTRAGGAGRRAAGRRADRPTPALLGGRRRGRRGARHRGPARAPRAGRALGRGGPGPALRRRRRPAPGRSTRHGEALDADGVLADETVTFSVAKPVHAAAAHRAGLRRADGGRHRARRVAGRRPWCGGWTPTTSRRSGRCPGRATTSTPAGCSAWSPAASPTPGRPCCCTGAAVRCGRRDGPLRRARRAPTELVRAAVPEVVHGVGPGAGLGRRARARHRLAGGGLARPSSTWPATPSGRRAVRRRRRRPRPARPGAVRRRRERVTLLTPHAGECARLLGRLGGEEVERAGVEAAPLAARAPAGRSSPARPCCSRAPRPSSCRRTGAGAGRRRTPRVAGDGRGRGRAGRAGRHAARRRAPGRRGRGARRRWSTGSRPSGPAPAGRCAALAVAHAVPRAAVAALLPARGTRRRPAALPDSLRTEGLTTADGPAQRPRRAPPPAACPSAARVR